MISKSQLHSTSYLIAVPKDAAGTLRLSFSDLFVDPRFVSAIVHLRENFANKREGTGDEWRGWMGALDALEALREPPRGDPGKVEPPAPYTKSQPAKQ